MLRVMRVGIVRIQGLDHIALRLGNKDLILAQHRFKFLAGQDRIEQILPFISSAKIASVMNKPDIIAVQMLPCPVNTRKFTVSRILDGDITGPSIQKMFGIKGHAEGSEDGIFPRETASGIRIISVNMLLEDEETPVIWRGPVLAGVVKQFWTDVIWGELDYLLVDLPPGTGDVPLTVFQSIPLDGIVIVTSPQSLVTMIVKKAYNMATAMNIPVLGIVENYSYIECPDCGKKIHVFGESHIEDIASALGLPVLGKMPIIPEQAALSDAGRFEEVDNQAIGEAVRVISEL